MLKAAIKIALTISFLAVSPALFASDPPPISLDRLPVRLYIPPVSLSVAPKTLVKDPGGPMTLARLKSIPFSGPVQYAFERELKRLGQSTSNAALKSDAEIAVNPAENLKRGGEPSSRSALGRFQPISTAYLSDTVNMTADSTQDAEPSVVAVNYAGGDYTVASANKYPLVGNVRVGRANVSTQKPDGTFIRNFELPYNLPLQSTYSESGDAVLAVNPYNNMETPKRIYCVGLLFNPNLQGAASAIALWRSTDGGQTWSDSPNIIASTAGGGFFVDKPGIAVSYYPNELGYVYVSWTTFDYRNQFINNRHSISVARSVDGGNTFSAPVVVTYDNVTNSELAIDSTYGAIYALWVNTRNEPANGKLPDIRMAKSPAGGLAFGAHDIVTSGNLLIGEYYLNGHVRAPTVPQARFNWHSNRLMVTWHQDSTVPGNGADVLYSFKPCLTVCSYWGWEQPIPIANNSVNDQFHPALDYTSTGDVIIEFYDRSSDAANLLYREYAAYVHSDGTKVQDNFEVSTFASDPRKHTNATGDAGFIGDFQDVWTWTYAGVGERAASSWIGIPDAALTGDVELSKVVLP